MRDTTQGSRPLAKVLGGLVVLGILVAAAHTQGTQAPSRFKV
jgi:hypothetical protein